MASERSVTVGNVTIGGGAPVVVQSMTLTKTHDVEATTGQIAALASAGCEVVRVAVPKTEDADALPKIVRFSPLPVIADIHFNASLALGLLNLLPVLPLDGGHIVIAIVEKLRGRTFTQAVYLRYSVVGLTIFAILLYFGLRNDLFGSGGG